MTPDKRAPPLLLVLLGLVLALGSMGAVYALWSDTLEINGTVHTGTLDAGWSFCSCSEFYPWPAGGHQGEFEGKDVGSTVCTIDQEDPQILHFAIANGYPSYAVDCQVHYQNSGTVPWIVRGTDIRATLGGNLTNCILSGNQTKTLRCDELTVKLVDGIGSQIDPADEAASSLQIHVEQPATEQTTYQFWVAECVAQWNEAPASGQCFAAAP